MSAPEPNESSVNPKVRAYVAPETSIRQKSPKAFGLPSRKVMMSGALALGAVVAFALMSGLSKKDRSYGAARSETEIHAAIPPATVRDAQSTYAEVDLAGANDAAAPSPADAAVAAQQASYPDPGDEGISRGSPPASLAGGSRYIAAAQTQNRDEDEALNAARASPITFGARGSARMSLREAGKNSMVLPNQLEAPASKFILQAGVVIPAALRTAINSDAPGRIVAQVTAPVYDSISGDYLLIPQGSRLIGTYAEGVRYGDRRVRIIWNRLILPNGWSMDLASMAATDSSGAAGLSAHVDDHLDRVMVASVLSGVLSTAANSAQDKNSSFWAQSIGDAAAQEAARAGGRIVDRELDVRPTLRIKAGSKVRVLVERDLVLKEYSQ